MTLKSKINYKLRKIVGTMAIIDQLKKLKEGAQNWNAWVRQQEFDFRADLADADLADAKLAGANLAGADLVEATLSDADLADADLSRANLTVADLIGADLTRADLTRADLTRAYLIEANLTGANLTHANLAGANLSKANLIGADLTSANLAGADLTDATLAGATLINAHLTQTDLTGAILAGADLTRANLACATLYRTYLTDSNLTEAILAEANLAYADLTDATLAGATLINAHLNSADFAGADLTEANLYVAETANTRFSSQSSLTHLKNVLSKQQMAGAIFHDETKANEEQERQKNTTVLARIRFPGGGRWTPMNLIRFLALFQLIYHRVLYLTTTEETDLETIRDAVMQPSMRSADTTEDIQIMSMRGGSTEFDIVGLAIAGHAATTVVATLTVIRGMVSDVFQNIHKDSDSLIRLGKSEEKTCIKEEDAPVYTIEERLRNHPEPDDAIRLLLETVNVRSEAVRDNRYELFSTASHDMTNFIDVTLKSLGHGEMQLIILQQRPKQNCD